MFYKKNCVNTMRCANLFIVFFCLIFFSGCSIKDTVNTRSDEDVLKERIMAYFNFKIKKEFDKSYEYEDPLYRKTISLSRYIKNQGHRQVKAARIENLSIEGDKASVVMTLRVKVRLVSEVGMAAQDIEHDAQTPQTWIKSDGQWYHAN
jgi:hypothetical protein